MARLAQEPKPCPSDTSRKPSRPATFPADFNPSGATNAQLRSLLAENGVPVHPRSKKAELLRAFEAHIAPGLPGPASLPQPVRSSTGKNLGEEDDTEIGRTRSCLDGLEELFHLRCAEDEPAEGHEQGSSDACEEENVQQPAEEGPILSDEDEEEPSHVETESGGSGTDDEETTATGANGDGTAAAPVSPTLQVVLSQIQSEMSIIRREEGKLSEGVAAVESQLIGLRIDAARSKAKLLQLERLVVKLNS